MKLREKTQERIDEIEKSRRKRETEIENFFIKDYEFIDLSIKLQ